MKAKQIQTLSATLALIVVTVLALGGCAATPTETVHQDEAPATAEPEWAIEPWDGYGLDIPMDGTSMQAWERSLLSVKAYSEPGDYELLLAAINYLKVYDIGARGDMERLVARLNGLTGYQIIARVNYRRPSARPTKPESTTDPGEPADPR